MLSICDYNSESFADVVSRIAFNCACTSPSLIATRCSKVFSPSTSASCESTPIISTFFLEVPTKRANLGGDRSSGPLLEPCAGVRIVTARNDIESVRSATPIPAMPPSGLNLSFLGTSGPEGEADL